MNYFRSRFLPFSMLIFLMFVLSAQKTQTVITPVLSDEELSISVYNDLFSGEKNTPDFQAFVLGYRGYRKLQMTEGLKPVLTVVDFSKPSTEKRLWILDLETNHVLLNTYVAHGINSGENYASSFSNKPGSNKSSLGFYLTGGTYNGKHGLSLKLKGMERGINNNALKRAIVLHGAGYVSTSFIDIHDRLGRSFGCPAVPLNQTHEIIDLIKGNTCLFIFYPDKEYLENSALI